jgi:hypothetical protein
MARSFPSRGVPRKGIWFPLTLGLLLLLALPGAILLLLALLGYENDVNGWLQNTLGLSYHPPVPAWVSLLLLLLPLVLILLYFLKLKRKPLQVPSTFLWRKSIEDLHVNSLFQWLRDNVLLLFQLLTLLLILFGILAVQVHGSTSSGKHYILLIDNSASMAVADEEGSRLEEAKKQALREIDAHAETDSGMIIAFNSRASILQPYTSDRGLLRRAVESIAQTQRPTRVDEALRLADSLANPLRSTDDQAVSPENPLPGQARTYVAAEGIAAEAHLFSDGRFPDLTEFSTGSLELTYHRIGKTGPEVDNVGLVTLNAVRDEQDPSKVQLLARVLNFRPSPADVRLEIEWRIAGKEDFHLLEKSLSLPARRLEPTDEPGEATASFELNDVDDSANVVVHARLRDLHDLLPLDDEGWLVLGVVRQARVLIVTDGNPVLHDFFDQEATTKVARVSYISTADLKDENKYGRPARGGDYDLVIFDRCSPPSLEALPTANTFFINAVPPPWQRGDMPALAPTPIRNPTSDHSLMRGLTALDEIAFRDAFRFDLKDPRVPPRVPRVLETDRETAVLFVLPRRAFQDVVLTFPLADSQGWGTTWVGKLSFPLFFRNLLYQLGNVRDAAAEENTQPGQVQTLRPDTAARTIDVTAPDGSRQTVTRGSQGDFSYNDTERVGVYRAGWPGGERSFAVNLLDADESNIQPRDEIQVGAHQLVAGQVRRQTYDTWKWGIVAALVFLLVEWLVYQRRIFF